MLLSNQVLRAGKWLARHLDDVFEDVEGVTAVQLFDVTFDTVGKWVWVANGASVNFLEQPVFARINNALGTEPHFWTGPAHVTVLVGILPNGVVVSSFAEQCVSVVVSQNLLVFVDKATVVAPCFSLLLYLLLKSSKIIETDQICCELWKGGRALLTGDLST